MYEILSISLLIAQGTWAKRYEAERYDYARAIVQKADGGYLIAGYTSSFGAGGGDFFLASISTDGDLLWAKVYGGSGDDLAYDLALVPGGHVIVVGESLSFGMGGYDAVVFRADPSGNLVWIRVIGGLYNDGFTKVIDHSGGILIAGYTQSAGAGNSDILLVWIRTARYSGAVASVERHTIGQGQARRPPMGSFSLGIQRAFPPKTRIWWSSRRIRAVITRIAYFLFRFEARGVFLYHRNPEGQPFRPLRLSQLAQGL
ncbi:MAG: hypothetical protein ABIM74_04690 [candidate division WOR-3 bacterium]